MPHLADNYFANPTGAMVTIKCSPWHVDGRSLLLGDAAHAIVPFFGQGMNCGFEDCTCVLELLDRYGADWERVFREFEEERKVNTDAIADMAVENFVEMRDRVADPRFLFRKKVELALEAKYPQLFVPKYAMVTFHRIPYAIALKRGRVQDRMLTELCDPIDTSKTLTGTKPTSSSAANSRRWSWFRDDFSISNLRRFRERRWMPAIPLAQVRERFLIPKTRTGEDCIYLCGHSLGLQPKTASEYIEQELSDWARSRRGRTFPCTEPVDALSPAAHRADGCPGGRTTR